MPIQFADVTDPSQTETAAGFTYYVSLNNGPFVGSSSPVYYLPSYAPDSTTPSRATSRTRRAPEAPSPP